MGADVLYRRSGDHDAAHRLPGRKVWTKRLFLVSVAGFTFASILCGFSQSLVQIVLFRVMQGLFGAALVPLSQTVLMNINPKERQGTVIAQWGVAVMAGPVLQAGARRLADADV